MQKRKNSVLKQRKTVGSSRRNILLQKVRRKILRRNNTYFLTSHDHSEHPAPVEVQVQV